MLVNVRLTEFLITFIEVSYAKISCGSLLMVLLPFSCIGLSINFLSLYLLYLSRANLFCTVRFQYKFRLGRSSGRL